jgi:hypothetical protein
MASPPSSSFRPAALRLDPVLHLKIVAALAPSVNPKDALERARAALTKYPALTAPELMTRARCGLSTARMGGTRCANGRFRVRAGPIASICAMP